MEELRVQKSNKINEGEARGKSSNFMRYKRYYNDKTGCF